MCARFGKVGHHHDETDVLLEHHLPEVKCGNGQWALCRDVTLIHGAKLHLYMRCVDVAMLVVFGGRQLDSIPKQRMVMSMMAIRRDRADFSLAVRLPILLVWQNISKSILQHIFRQRRCGEFGSGIHSRQQFKFTSEVLVFEAFVENNDS